MNEEQGVTTAEDTAISSPEETTETTETNLEDASSEESTSIVQEKTVPYDRFKKVVEEKNTYKELLASVKPTVETEIQKPIVDDTYGQQPIEDVTKFVEKKVEQKFDLLNRQLELDRTIQKNPDFFQYADSIKAKIQETPNLSWEDAYKLSKFDASIAEAVKIGRQEATQQIQAKKKAVVETASKTKSNSINSSDDFNPLAKGPDGKFLYSTKELEDILPRG